VKLDVLRDGNAVGVIIHPDLQAYPSGFGKTLADLHHRGPTTAGLQREAHRGKAILQAQLWFGISGLAEVAQSSFDRRRDFSSLRSRRCGGCGEGWQPRLLWFP